MPTFGAVLAVLEIARLCTRPHFSLSKALESEEKTAEIAKAWCLVLGDLSDSDLSAALSAWVRSNSEFPMPADLLGMIDAFEHDTSSEAWGKVLSAIRRHGRYNRPKDLARAIDQAIDVVGGWKYLCDMPANGPTHNAIRSAFKNAYDAGRRLDRDRASAGGAVRALSDRSKG